MLNRAITAAAILVLASAGTATSRPFANYSPAVTLVAGEAVNSNLQSELENARRYIAAHDMAAAERALDRAGTMARADAKMSGMAAHITQARQMLMAGDATNASKMLDGIITEVEKSGSGG